MTILVDMDGTIADLIGYFIDTYELPDGTSVDREDVIHYDITKTWPNALERFEKRFSPFEWLEPMPGMADAIEDMLDSDHKVFIVSSAISKPWIMKEKLRWIARELPFFDIQNVIFTNDKSVFNKNCILIDDNPKFINSFPGTRIVFDAAYNRGDKVSADARLRSWEDWNSLDLDALVKKQRD
jgi:5'(3')-deoxyribonucleotidase